jgi:hypothetical protein
VQWGGISPDAGKLPSSFKDFITIFFAKQLGTNDTLSSKSNPELNSELSNRIGNHLGMRDMGIDLIFKKFNTGIYFQSYYEDNSSLNWHNLPDGLYGIYFKPKNIKWISDILYEYIETTNQSEPYRNTTIYPGSDNLFNNYVYKSGWTYNGFTLGTPLITSPVLLKKNGFPTSYSNYLKNNRIQAHHIGICGQVESVNFKALLTYNLNYGTYYVPFNFTKKAIMTYLELNKHFNYFGGIEVSTILANDFGSMYANKTSFIFTIKKKGLL